MTTTSVTDQTETFSDLVNILTLTASWGLAAAGPAPQKG